MKFLFNKEKIADFEGLSRYLRAPILVEEGILDVMANPLVNRFPKRTKEEYIKFLQEKWDCDSRVVAGTWVFRKRFSSKSDIPWLTTSHLIFCCQEIYRSINHLLGNEKKTELRSILEDILNNKKADAIEGFPYEGLKVKELSIANQGKLFAYASSKNRESYSFLEYIILDELKKIRSGTYQVSFDKVKINFNVLDKSNKWIKSYSQDNKVNLNPTSIQEKNDIQISTISEIGKKWQIEFSDDFAEYPVRLFGAEKWTREQAIRCFTDFTEGRYQEREKGKGIISPRPLSRGLAGKDLSQVVPMSLPSSLRRYLQISPIIFTENGDAARSEVEQRFNYLYDIAFALLVRQLSKQDKDKGKDRNVIDMMDNIQNNLVALFYSGFMGKNNDYVFTHLIPSYLTNFSEVKINASRDKTTGAISYNIFRSYEDENGLGKSDVIMGSLRK
jgi:hypothetical protein